MTEANPAFSATNTSVPRDGPKRLARTEATIALLQCGVAFVFVIGAYTGLFDIPSPTREICVAWLWLYHVWVTIYSSVPRSGQDACLGRAAHSPSRSLLRNRGLHRLG